MHGRTDWRTTDNRPWHKLAGLWPVELKIAIVTINNSKSGFITSLDKVISCPTPFNSFLIKPSGHLFYQIKASFQCLSSLLLNLLSQSCLTLSQTSSSFYVTTGQIFWKHHEKRRNYSKRAISTFPTVFFYPFGKLSGIFICQLFQFWRVQNLSFGKGSRHNPLLYVELLSITNY